MKNIGIILKKELKRFFTDRRMLIAIFLPGILIFLVYSLMGNLIDSFNDSSITEFNIYIENEPTELKSLFDNPEWKENINEKDLTKEEILSGIENKEIDLYIIYPDGFYTSMMEYNSAHGGEAPNVEMYYNSASEGSSTIYQYYSSVLLQMESAISNKFDINSGDTVYDLANEDDTTIMIFTSMLPFLLIIFLFSGAMGICSESIAGEKERGTIATLLVTPVKRGEIAIGKVIGLGITSLASAVVSFVGLIASLPKLVGTDLSLSAYGFSTIMMLLLIIIVTALFFTVLLTMVSTFAKSIKEATSLSIPVMIVVMLLGVTSFMSTQAATNPALYLIPVYGSIQSLTAIFSTNVDPLCFILCAVSNLVYIGLGVFALTRMFNSERIMFNK